MTGPAEAPIRRTRANAPVDCAQCGQIHPRGCIGHHTRDGSPCENWPRKGQQVCGTHGGSAPQAKAKARERQEEGLAREELVRLGEPAPIEHPVVELLRVAAVRKTWSDIIRNRLGSLRDLVKTDTFGVERERALVAIYERALDGEQRAYEALAKLDLDARRFRLGAQQAELTLRALEAAWRVLPGELAEAARSAFVAEFRALAPLEPDGAVVDGV